METIYCAPNSTQTIGLWPASWQILSRSACQPALFSWLGHILWGCSCQHPCQMPAKSIYWWCVAACNFLTNWDSSVFHQNGSCSPCVELHAFMSGLRFAVGTGHTAASCLDNGAQYITISAYLYLGTVLHATCHQAVLLIRHTNSINLKPRISASAIAASTPVLLSSFIMLLNAYWSSSMKSLHCGITQLFTFTFQKYWVEDPVNTRLSVLLPYC